MYGDYSIFDDRVDAGRKLAERLERFRGPDTIVLAIPRGGVVIGYEVAKMLGVPLDVTVPRKIGAPGQPELAIGAIGDDVVVLDETVIGYLAVPRSYIDQEIERQRQEIRRRMQRYRGDRPFPDLRGKTVLLVDDGMATGSTTIAAARSVHECHPGRLILAVPVAPPETVAKLRPEVDEIIVLETPEPFYAVGAWYANFEQTTDEEVIGMLNRSHHLATSQA